jgi:hypothetical protein
MHRQDHGKIHVLLKTPHLLFQQSFLITVQCCHLPLEPLLYLTASLPLLDSVSCLLPTFPFSRAFWSSLTASSISLPSQLPISVATMALNSIAPAHPHLALTCPARHHFLHTVRACPTPTASSPEPSLQLGSWSEESDSL